jgi:hypothetical protein
MIYPVILATAAANIAIGGHAATNGLIYGCHFLLLWLFGFAGGADWEEAGLVAAILTGVYAAWRSPSPRGAELDLLWENPDMLSPDLGRDTTHKEILRTLMRHNVALMAVSFASFLLSRDFWTCLLPLLAVVPVISHLAAWNKTAFGRWLASKDDGYPRRFGELIAGALMHGVALSVLGTCLADKIETFLQ